MLSGSKALHNDPFAGVEPSDFVNKSAELTTPGIWERAKSLWQLSILGEQNAGCRYDGHVLWDDLR